MNDVTFNLEIDHKEDRKGLSRVYIRVTHDGRLKRIKTPVKVPKLSFDRNAKAKKWINNSVRDRGDLNTLLYSQMLKVQSEINDYIYSNGSFDIKSYFDKGQKVEIVNTECYFQFGFQEYKRLLSMDKLGTANKRRNSHNRFAKFYNGRELSCFSASKELKFVKITPRLLEDFRTSLVKEGLADNTVKSMLKEVRSVYNQAIKEGLVSQVNSPFSNRRFVVGAMRTSQKVKLDEHEILNLLHLEDLSKKEKYALDLFLFSFYTYGMRVGDVFNLKWSNIDNGRLNYKMSKNGKQVPEIKLSPYVIQLLESYYKEGNTYIFPPFNTRPEHIQSKTNRKKIVDCALCPVNKELKRVARKAGINKTISMHVARHSFANIAKQRDVPVEKIKEMLCHSNLQTTYLYLASFNDKKLQVAGDEVYRVFGDLK